MNAKPGDPFYAAIRSESPLIQPGVTKAYAEAIISQLAGEMLVWKDEYLTDKNAERTPVDLNKIEVPLYPLYSATTGLCLPDVNKKLLEDVAAVKRSITWESSDGSEAPDSVDLWKSPEKVSVDIVTILGSGAHALIAGAAALTLLSTV